MAFEFDLEKVKAGLINVGKDVEEFAKNTSNTAKIKYDIHNKENCDNQCVHNHFHESLRLNVIDAILFPIAA